MIKNKNIMKKVTLFALLIIAITGCNGDYVKNGKHVYPKYRELYRSYCDSSDKYFNIDNDCGRKLFHYYSEKAIETYTLIYPQGNPIDVDMPKYDTICYPIK